MRPGLTFAAEWKCCGRAQQKFCRPATEGRWLLSWCKIRGWHRAGTPSISGRRAQTAGWPWSLTLGPRWRTAQGDMIAPCLSQGHSALCLQNKTQTNKNLTQLTAKSFACPHYQVLYNKNHNYEPCLHFLTLFFPPYLRGISINSIIALITPKQGGTDETVPVKKHVHQKY